MRMQDDFLHAPIGGFRHVDQIFRRAGQLMATGKCAELPPRLTDYSEDFAIERDLEDAPGESEFTDEKHLVRPRGDADRIGRAVYGERVEVSGGTSMVNWRRNLPSVLNT